MLSIDITLKPSPLFKQLYAATMISCIFIIATLPLGIVSKLLLLIVVAAYSAQCAYRWVYLRGNGVIRRLTHDSAGWELSDAQGVIYRAELRGESTLTPFLSILRFTAAGLRRTPTCLVFKDMLKPDVYRQLQVALRTATIH